MYRILPVALLAACLLLSACSSQPNIDGAWVQYGGKGWSGFAVEFSNGHYRAWQYSDIPIGNMFEPPSQPLRGRYERSGNAVVLLTAHDLLSPVWFLGHVEGQAALLTPSDWAVFRASGEAHMADLLVQDPDFNPEDPFAAQTEAGNDVLNGSPIFPDKPFEELTPHPPSP